MTAPTLESQLSLSVAITDPDNVSKSVRVSFREPLNREDQCFIEWLSDRYQGRDGTPVMCFISDGVRVLVVPTDLQRKRASND